MSLPPDFHDLIGDEGTPEEQGRLRQVHDLLVAAGPPPELPRALEAPPRVGARLLHFPRRRFETALAAAAAAVAIAFGVGYLVGSGGNGFSTRFAVGMHGIGAASAARASIAIAAQDAQGNWPLQLTVRGLKRLPRGGWYTLYLTKHGRIELSCGTFNADGGATTVHMSVPYRLGEYDGWVITAHLPGQPNPSPVLLTT